MRCALPISLPVALDSARFGFGFEWLLATRQWLSTANFSQQSGILLISSLSILCFDDLVHCALLDVRLCRYHSSDAGEPSPFGLV